MKKLNQFLWIGIAILITTISSFKVIQYQDYSNTYYVDSQSGNDLHNGLTPIKAWKSLNKLNKIVFKPGDIIFLKCNSVWEGQLLLRGSGNSKTQIKITSYGKGKKPAICGNGKFDQVILLEDIEGWHIENLDLSNKATSLGNRTAILVRSLANLTRKNFKFTNLYIHDVMGDYSFETKGKNTGGIGIIGGPDTKFDHILIENCEIANINRVGIFTNLTNGNQAKRGNRPFTNLVIKNNKIHHCAGDGAIIRYAYRPLISHNLAYENHNGPEDLVKHGVALWCRSTDEATFEYNEVHHTRGAMDGQAFDADLDSYRTLVQYNYTHDNEGGFMLVYGSSSEAIVRYNLSVNDGIKGKHIFDFPKWTNPRGAGIFHNNTIVFPKDSNVVIADEALATAKFYNNIFYQWGNAQLVIRSEGKTAQFLNNSYYGFKQVNLIEETASMSEHQNNVLPEQALEFKNSKLYYKLLTVNDKKKSGVVVHTLLPDYWLPNSSGLDFRGKKINPNKLPIGAFKY